jgi:hypothetical protein
VEEVLIRQRSESWRWGLVKVWRSLQKVIVHGTRAPQLLLPGLVASLCTDHRVGIPSLTSSSHHHTMLTLASPSPAQSSLSKPSRPEIKRDSVGVSEKLRRHAGNVPVLPQTKLCPQCPAKFTRSTHLNRHLKTRECHRIISSLSYSSN